MINSSIPSKSAINPLAFLPFGIYVVTFSIQILLNLGRYGIYYRGNDGFFGFLRDWVLPGVFLLVSALTISKKFVSIAFAALAIIFQLFVIIQAKYITVFLSPSEWLGYGWDSDIEYIVNLIAIFVAPILAIVIAITWKKSNTSSGMQATFPGQAPPAALGTPAQISTPVSVGASATANPWAIQIPGQPETQVTTEQLSYWAKIRAIRPETMVKDIQNNAMYPASQIPGVYSDKSFVVAVLLSWFLGILGVDRFYTGHIGLGIGKLLTLGGLGFWALIDFILYITRKVTDVNGRPLR